MSTGYLIRQVVSCHARCGQMFDVTIACDCRKWKGGVGGGGGGGRGEIHFSSI